MHGLTMIMQKNTKICLTLPRIPYKQFDFDYLENFAAPLMGRRTRIWKPPSMIFLSTENLWRFTTRSKSLQIIILYLHVHVRVVIR